MEAVHGMGPAKAAQISACFELSRRYPEKDPVPILRVTRPEDVIAILNGLEFKKQEHFICITLNGAGEVLGNRIITVGLLNHSLVHPREVFADAITDRAASIICVHNHPSGTLEPSPQDLEVTRQTDRSRSYPRDPGRRSPDRHQKRFPLDERERAPLKCRYKTDGPGLSRDKKITQFSWHADGSGFNGTGHRGLIFGSPVNLQSYPVCTGTSPGHPGYKIPVPVFPL